MSKFTHIIEAIDGTSLTLDELSRLHLDDIEALRIAREHFVRLDEFFRADEPESESSTPDGTARQVCPKSSKPCRRNCRTASGVFVPEVTSTSTGEQQPAPHGEHEYVCPHCTKICVSEQSLKSHITKRHSVFSGSQQATGPVKPAGSSGMSHLEKMLQGKIF